MTFKRPFNYENDDVSSSSSHQQSKCLEQGVFEHIKLCIWPRESGNC